MKRFLTYTTRANISRLFYMLVFLAFLRWELFSTIVAAMAAGAGFAMLVILSGTMMPSRIPITLATERTFDAASQTLKTPWIK